MRRRDVILIAAGAVLLMLVAVFAVRIASHYQSQWPGTRVEAGRVKLTQLDAQSKQQLATLEHDVLVTYYVSGRQNMPSNMRRIERDVTDMLRAMRRASDGALDYQIIDPDTEPDFAAHAAHHRAAPFRVRSVSRDAYTQQTVWSTLHIAYGPHDPAVINGISPDHLPHLQSLILGQLEQKDQPREPVFALAASAAYSDLAAWLQRRGTVVRVDPDASSPIPHEADVLFWMDPVDVDAAMLRQVQRFMKRGRSVVVAGSSHTLNQENEALQLQSTGYEPGALLAPFGIQPIDGMALDESSVAMPGEHAPVPAKFRIRVTPPNQDFRRMRELPNGHLLFDVPTPLTLDANVLDEIGMRATVLATTSDRTTLGTMRYGDVNLHHADYHAGDPVPKLPLMIWLQPHAAWEGSLVACASSSAFRDGAFTAGSFAHQRLVDVLVQTLASDERLVLHRAGLRQADPLPELGPTARLAWRSFCIAVLPACLLVLAWRRGALKQLAAGNATRRAAALPVVAVVLFIPAALGMVLHAAPAWQFDATAGNTNQLARTTGEVARAAAEEQAVTITLYISQHHHLPPHMRARVRRAEAMIEQLRRAGADLAVQRIYPETLTAEKRDALHEAGITPTPISTRDASMTVVRRVYSTIAIESNGRRELLHTFNRASFEHLEFRLAFALWRLHTGRQVHIAFAADVPRLSAAEAYQDFQQRSLLAPTGTDVYSNARGVLRDAGFRVTHVNPRNPDMPDDVDLIVWMQPRRDILPMLENVVEHLHRGVPVIIAAQHYNMQARQYRGSDFDMVYWPQPQVADLELHYLPDVGILLSRDVLFDQLKDHMPLQTQVNRTAEQRDYVEQTTALPFLIRAAAANFRAHPITRNLGDQRMPFASYWSLDAQRLEELGLTATPLLRSSDRAWRYAWTGGWLPESLLAGPPEADDDIAGRLSRVPLAVLVQGQFPLPQSPLTDRRVDEASEVQLASPAGQESEMLLIGCSEMFKNPHISNDTYRSDHLLLNAAATLALDDDLATVASHRTVARGFDYIEPHVRLRWRTIVLAAGPVAIVFVGMVWFACDRTTRRSAA